MFLFALQHGFDSIRLDRYSSVSIATQYGLDYPRIESRWGVRFFVLVHTGCGAHPASHTMGNGSFPEVTRPRLEQYLNSPSGLSRPFLRWTLPLAVYFVLYARVVRLFSSAVLLPLSSSWQLPPSSSFATFFSGALLPNLTFSFRPPHT